MPIKILDYQIRVINELDLLREAITRLQKALKFGAHNVPEDEHDLLKEQAEHMVSYAKVLEQRISIWSNPYKGY